MTSIIEIVVLTFITFLPTKLIRTSNQTLPIDIITRVIHAMFATYMITVCSTEAHTL